MSAVSPTISSPAVEGAAAVKRPGISHLLKYGIRYWRGWLMILLLTLLASGVALLTPWPMQILVDYVLQGREVPATLEGIVRPLGGTSPRGLLLIAVFGGIVIFALSIVVETLLTFSWIRVGQKMVYELMGDLFGRVERRSMLFHTQRTVGDAMTRITGDSWAVHGMIENVLFTPLHATVLIVSISLVMWRIDPMLTLIALAVAPVMAAASLLRRKPVRAAHKKRREIESAIFAHVQQVLSGISVVQAFSQEQRERERFEDFAGAAVQAQRKGVVASSISGLMVGLVAVVGNGTVLYVGVQRVMAGQLGLGTLLMLMAYVVTLQAQMKALAGVYIKSQTLRPSMERVLELMTEDDLRESPNARGIERARGHVVISDVTFGYGKDRPVLQGVSVEALPGQTVAIVGPTGAGKSTMAGLLARFFDPWSGKVVLDGHDLRELKLMDVRKQVGMVLQEPFLFPRSIAENIAYGRPGASAEEIEAASRAANAHEFIVQLPEGYETVIGERGATLSGGQRQRLSIARALLKNAPVLILDEPTSALDAGTEALLLEALERLMAGRTTFIIAHRFTTIRNADKIVVLENGRVVEVGKHMELVERGGLYSRLHHMQAGTSEPCAAG